jgi:hypothetical protein
VILLEAAQQFGSVTMNFLPEALTYELQLELKEIEVAKNIIALPHTKHCALPVSAFGTKLRS